MNKYEFTGKTKQYFDKSRTNDVNKESEYYEELSDKLDMPDLETIKAYAGDAPATVMMNNSDEDKKYAVEITETLKKIVVAEADSFAEAKEKVEAAYNREDIVLTADDFDETNFTETDIFGANSISNDESIDNYEILDNVNLFARSKSR